MTFEEFLREKFDKDDGVKRTFDSYRTWKLNRHPDTWIEYSEEWHSQEVKDRIADDLELKQIISNFVRPNLQSMDFAKEDEQKEILRRNDEKISLMVHAIKLWHYRQTGAWIDRVHELELSAKEKGEKHGEEKNN